MNKLILVLIVFCIATGVYAATKRIDPFRDLSSHKIKEKITLDEYISKTKELIEELKELNKILHQLNLEKIEYYERVIQRQTEQDPLNDPYGTLIYDLDTLENNHGVLN